MHLLVCYLNKLQNARCNDKDTQDRIFCTEIGTRRLLNAMFILIVTASLTEF